jgi:hypothetical protein
MAKQFESISEELQEFIQNQKIFFVGTAAADGRVNVSPKGMDTFRVLDKNKAVWLNLTGSGNETAAHVQQKNRITIMFCAFEGKPLILRLYGTAKIYHAYDPEWETLIHHFPEIAGSRQIFEIDIDLVQTSCGMAVPFFEYSDDRRELENWAQKQGDERLIEYRKMKNTISMDGFETNVIGK